MSDRYLKIVLTVIAIELAWIGVTHRTVPVSAQAGATPVVIRGIELGESAYLPVAVLGGYHQVPARVAPLVGPLAVSVSAVRPLPIEAPAPIAVRTVAPVKVETDRPLLVESVRYTPGARPGE